MTLMHIVLVATHAVFFGAGWYGHKKFGPKVAADLSKVA